MMRGWGSFEAQPAPESEPSHPKPGPPKRIPRVRVENPGKDKALTKLATTTEALTADERRILRGYRLSVGGDTSRLERMRVELDIAMGRDQ